MDLVIHTDGGSRGNPGQAGVGVVIELKVKSEKLKSEKLKVVEEFGKRIGVKTNNEAEYQAVIEALREVKSEKLEVRSIELIMDSKLVCEQLSGNWKIKQDHLKALFSQVKSLEFSLGVPISYTHILREKNKRADQLLNNALDKA